MPYHFTPMTKHHHPESPYDGLHLGTSRIRLSQRFAARFGGVRRARLSYDTAAKTICLTPSDVTEGPAGPDIYRISRDPHGGGSIYCGTLHAVMPAGRYRLLKQTREGYICKHEQAER
jgi:hypothetical protein